MTSGDPGADVSSLPWAIPSSAPDSLDTLAITTIGSGLCAQGLRARRHLPIRASTAGRVISGPVQRPTPPCPPAQIVIWGLCWHGQAHLSPLLSPVAGTSAASAGCRPRNCSCLLPMHLAPSSSGPARAASGTTRSQVGLPEPDLHPTVLPPQGWVLLVHSAPQPQGWALHPTEPHTFAHSQRGMFAHLSSCIIHVSFIQ